ncbi:MAG: hypothetical protein CVU97_00430 [Firmicutes bacterium HGW-Firmicutes-21]|nr:MAG: hypothetical protein CVU97_00430 [Firmicutes bacterium HGW-Firmicutes-21]
MNLNKKIFALLLVFVMLFTMLSIPAFAEEDETFAITYTLPTGATVSFDPEGVHTTNGSVHTYTFVKGTTATMTVTTSSGYELNTITANSILQNVSGKKTYSQPFVDNTNVVITTKAVTPERKEITVNDSELFTYVLEGADNNNMADVGSTVVLKITPIANHSVKRIVFNGTEVTSGNNYSFTVVQTNNIVVTVEENVVVEPKILTVSITGSGTVTPNGGSFAPGTERELTITPATGYILSSFTVNGVAKTVSSSNKYTVKMDVDTDVVAVFVKSVTLTVTIGSNGSVTINGIKYNSSVAVKVPEGSDVIIKVSPNLGYTVSSLKVENATVSLDGENTYTISAISENKKVAAAFVAATNIKQYTITSSAGANGTITPSGTNVVEEGKDITFTIIPDNGYEIDSVKVDGAIVPLTNSQYKFTNVGANQNIIATFKPTQQNNDDDPISVDDINWSSPTTITIDISKNTKVSAEVFQKITDDCKNKIVIFAAANYKWTLPKGADVSIESDYADLAIMFDGGARYNEIKQYLNSRVEDLHFVLISYGNSFTFPKGTILSLNIGVDFENQEVQQLIYNGETKKLTNPLNSAGNEAYDVRAINDDGWVSIYFYNSTDIVLCNVLDPYYTIVASASAGGTINPSGNKRVNTGGSVVFNITANEGYVINSLLINGVEHTGASGETNYDYPFNTVAKDHTIHVNFVRLADYIPPSPPIETNSGLIVSLIIIFLAVAGAAVLFIIKWRQEKY